MSTGSLGFLCWNVEKGHYVEKACRWADKQQAEVVFWQELQPDDVEVVAELLGMTAYVAEPRANSTNCNALFLREGGAFELDTEHRHPATRDAHALANISVRLRRGDEVSDRALSLFSVHSSYNSPVARLTEAEFLTRFAEPGKLAVAMGDFNSLPAGAEMDWSKVTDRAYYAHRTYLNCDGRRYTDDRPDRTLTAAGYVDAALWAAKRHGQHRAVTPTVGHRPHKATQGGATRIDRGYVVDELAPAVTRFQVGKAVELGEVSDHLPLWMELDRAALEKTMFTTPDQPS